MAHTYKFNDFRSYTVFKPFKITTNINNQDVALSLKAGEEFQYDGFVLRYGGTEYRSTSLRSAETKGWIVPTEAYNPDAAFSDSANVRVKTPANEKTGAWESTIRVHEDERPVMDVSRHASGVVATNSRRFTNSAVVVEDPGVVIKTGFAVQAGLNSNFVDPNQTRSLIADIERKARLVPGESVDRPMDEESEAELASIREATRQRLLSDVTLHAPSPADHIPERTVYKEGVKLTTNFAPRSELQLPAPPPPPQRMVPASNAPEKKKMPELKELSPEVKFAMAKAICADFPERYDFSAPAKKRVALLQLDYDNRPDIIAAAYRVEAQETKLLLSSTFPEVFAE
jgi:hypothetical protein